MESLWSWAIRRTVARDCWTKQGRGAARFVGFPGRYVTRQYLIYPWSAQSVPIPPFSPTILHLRIAFVIWRYCWAVAISLDPTPYPSRVRRATGAATCRQCCGLSRCDTTYLTLPTTCCTSVIISMNLDYSVYVNIVFSFTQNVSQSWMYE